MWTLTLGLAFRPLAGGAAAPPLGPDFNYASDTQYLMVSLGIGGGIG